MPSLDVICVEWKSGALLGECVHSIAESDLAGLQLQRVLVVDNSEDGASSLSRLTGLPLTVIRNARNVGFGVACNQGAQDSKADYVVFLNPDIRLKPHALSQAIAAMETPTDARAVGVAGIRLTDVDGRTLRSCARLPTPLRMLAQSAGIDRIPGLSGLRHFMTDWDHNEDRDVPQVMGACMIVRRTMFETLDGFDERFFLYYEDVDLCARAWQLGWRCRFYATPSAVHLGGGTTSQIKALRAFYNARSRVLYAHKHFGVAVAIAIWLAALVVEPVSRTLRAFLAGRFGDARDTWHATMMLAAATPALFKRAL